MTREETIERLCKLVAVVWKQIDPESRSASDCFCHNARPHISGLFPIEYRNEGEAIEFIERAVDQALEGGMKAL
jgi:hypothetical protein